MWLKTFIATWKLTSTLLYNPSIKEDVKTEIRNLETWIYLAWGILYV